MKYIIIIFILSFLGCDTLSPKQGEELDQLTIFRTERFVPTNFGYSLLEVVADTLDIDGLRYLYLYDENDKFVDGTILYGTVQKFEKDKIEINKNFSGRTGFWSIGDLKINYKDIKVSKGGGGDGEFIVDSMIYNRKKNTVSLFFKKSKEWFGNEDCSEQILLVRPIMDINFEPFEENYFTITDWEKNGIYNTTKSFKCKDDKVLSVFFNKIRKNGL